MFNYKTWKLYSIGDGGIATPVAEPDPAWQKDPDPVDENGNSITPVVDENGNSITPDSLKKNITIPAEAPGNDLEKVLSNMNGTDPAYPVEGSSGLIKQLNKFAENPPSGGGFDYVTFTGGGQVGVSAYCDKTFDEISKMKTPIGHYEGRFFMLHYNISERTGVASYDAAGFIVNVSGTNATVVTSLSIDSNNSVVIATQIRHFAS